MSQNVNMRRKSKVSNYVQCFFCNGPHHISVCQVLANTVCSRCKIKGHTAGKCNTPFCTSCKGFGHIVRNCPTPFCLFCQTLGHSINDCQSLRETECGRCGGFGHTPKHCTIPQCSFCKNFGHELRHPNGTILCLELLNTVCPRCKQKGHTSKTCTETNESAMIIREAMWKAERDAALEAAREAKLKASRIMIDDRELFPSLCSKADDDFPALSKKELDNDLVSQKSFASIAAKPKPVVPKMQFILPVLSKPTYNSQSGCEDVSSDDDNGPRWIAPSRWIGASSNYDDYDDDDDDDEY